MALERLGVDVARELRRFGPAGAMAEIVAAWAAAVGPAVSTNAWPARLARDGTLHVSTASSVWAYELAQLQTPILARLGEALQNSVVTKLRFGVGPLPATAVADGQRERPKTLPRPTDEERRRAEEIAGPISNEELRAIVARAAAASLAAAGSDRPF